MVATVNFFLTVGFSRVHEPTVNRNNGLTVATATTEHRAGHRAGGLRPKAASARRGGIYAGPDKSGLAEVYAFAGELARLHPRNLHVRDKIRQQLQRLRDLGFVEFLGAGKYRLL